MEGCPWTVVNLLFFDVGEHTENRLLLDKWSTQNVTYSDFQVEALAPTVSQLTCI